ncbi:alpha-amylase family glycosyl hydrolase [Phycisphaerales bacterium AB-hyl4]|uniref:1,4-alpha-glucan branching enzyme n=1 Tax=Natronomicrosphaera hydrolytica TaxID=3242702 RepID=A0ABV4UA62_9BACT
MSRTTKRKLAGTGLADRDPWLEPHREKLHQRYQHLQRRLEQLGGMNNIRDEVSKGHTYFGLNRGEHEGKPGVWYREWAPGAQHLALIGDFNNWDRDANPMQRDEYGVWHLFLPDSEYADRLTHESLLKVHVVSEAGEHDRIPAYVRRVIQDPETHGFTAQYWQPPTPYRFKNKTPKLDAGLRIYEAHIGMATEESRVGSFNEFTENVLPRIANLGYNAIQLMAIQEHPYYGSFGYHVSSFFAVSSRFGTPDDLKKLIDTAHGLGIRVLLDVVHSHAVKNINEGLNRFDGTDHQYFHGGPRGEHPAWDSKLFDYNKYEVNRFLLSNVRYWLDEFKFDGFRFDGVTSMIYLDHGLGADFNSYDDYFGDNIDDDAVAYLQIANQLAQKLRPDVITISEDVSGMVGMARPVKEGGLGFDYRLAMGVPDNWIKLLKEKQDEDWNLNQIYHILMNRRHDEKHVGYAESHDQALVGDKTIAFWLMDKEMYWHMGKASDNIVIDRGIALHKIIRLLSFSLAGEAWLNFIGNEFGHPEWVDFPREGNGFSYQHARRQWSLADNEELRYSDLNEFDRAMQQLDKQFAILPDKFIEQLAVNEDDKVLIYRRGPLVFAVNLHPTRSYTDYRIPVPDSADYKLVLDTDASAFGGHARLQADAVYPKQDVEMFGRSQSVQLYLPTRTAQVIAPVT